MRTRSRLMRSLAPLKGDNYSWWINHWLWLSQDSDPGVTFRNVIVDDLGRQRVNPLHSVQWVATRDSVRIEAYRNTIRYTGEVGVTAEQLSVADIDLWSVQDLSAWGTKGAQRTRLIKPFIDLPVVLGELTEAHQMVTGLHSATKHIVASSDSRRHAIERLDNFIKGVGETDLYAAFGILPIVDTVARLLVLEPHIRETINALLEINNKWIHRTTTLMRDNTSRTYTIRDDGLFPKRIAQPWMKTNVLQVQETRSERIWFSTWIRLKLPDLDPSALREFLLGKLYGGSPFQGRVLYELLPYSWLADWFTSAGAFIANAMDHTLYEFDRPCTMHETILERRYQGLMRYYDDLVVPGDKLAAPSAYSRLTIKRREPWLWSSPGVTLPGTLSTYRAFIAASLAAAKLPV